MKTETPASQEPAVVLVFVHQARLEWHERIGLQQCATVLRNHPIFLVCPEGLDVSEHLAVADNLQVDRIPPRWQASYQAYNRLKILPFLYHRYAHYEFILTHELDAFVFRDELGSWCREGWDYVGAPWFAGGDGNGAEVRPLGVGNSGFSLRRPAAMLRVLHSFGRVVPSGKIISRWRKARRETGASFWLLVSLLTWRNNFHHWFNDFAGPEDVFWCKHAAPRFPWMKLAPYEVGRRFSFEAQARRLYAELGGQLPFGCHQWHALDRPFWRPFIRSFGYDVPT